VRPPAAKIPVLCDKRCSRDSEADGLKLARAGHDAHIQPLDHLTVTKQRSIDAMT